MSEQTLLDEYTDILDEYFDQVNDISSKPVYDTVKREETYTAVALLIADRITYIQGCDPSRTDTLDHARSLAHMLAIFIGALANCPDNKQEDVQHKNTNYFLDILYKAIDDPLTFSAVTFSGMITLMSIMGMDRGEAPRQASSAEIVQLVTKARKDGNLKVYAAGSDGSIGDALTEEEMDDLIGDFMGGDTNGTIH